MKLKQSIEEMDYESNAYIGKHTHSSYFIVKYFQKLYKIKMLMVREPLFADDTTLVACI